MRERSFSDGLLKATGSVSSPAEPLLSHPSVVSRSERAGGELIWRDFTCSVSHTLPAGAITSLSDYSTTPAVLPVNKITQETWLG